MSDLSDDRWEPCPHCMDWGCPNPDARVHKQDLSRRVMKREVQAVMFPESAGRLLG